MRRSTAGKPRRATSCGDGDFRDCQRTSFRVASIREFRYKQICRASVRGATSKTGPLRYWNIGNGVRDAELASPRPSTGRSVHGGLVPNQPSG